MAETKKAKKRIPPYPNRIYKTKRSAIKASNRYGGKGVKRVEITRYSKSKGYYKLKGWGISW